jgi:hypothetical protein
MKKIFLIFLLVSFSFGQDQALTNSDVIEMVKAGLPESVILSKINASKTEFDTEIEGLKSLNEAGVSETVISAMIERRSVSDSNQPEESAREIEYSSKDAEYGDVSELKGKSKVFVAVPDLEARKIIIGRIRKDSRLTIVDDRKDADFGINYFSQVVERGSNTILGTVSNKALVGELIAYTYLPVKPGDTHGRIRVVWSKRKVQDWSGGLTFDKNPAGSTIGSFLKDFKKIK